jgi:hypothetical protein
MRKPILGAALAGLLIPAGPPLAQPGNAGAWQKGFHPGIARALAKQQIRGCGTFRYQGQDGNPDVFRVECSKDGKGWTAYRVNVTERTVEGPLGN